MPKQLLSIPSFTAGELSSSMEGRTDFAKYFNGASNIENFVVLPHGPVTRRPGTYFVSEVKTSANSTRLIPFLSESNLAIFKSSESSSKLIV